MEQIKPVSQVITVHLSGLREKGLFCGLNCSSSRVKSLAPFGPVYNKIAVCRLCLIIQ